MNNKKGFTLIEILLVIAAISILASIVIVAINPAKQLGETRNAQRRSDVKTILDAVWQYAVDNNGNLPSAITTTDTPICTGIPASVTACTNATPDYIDLASATTALDIAAQKYIVALPTDPRCSAVCADGSIGYSISKSSNGRVTVTSLHVEQITRATGTTTTGNSPTVTITSGGSGYTSAPPVVFSGGTCTTYPVGSVSIASGAVTGVTIATAGTGCSTGPTTVTFAPPIFVSR